MSLYAGPIAGFCLLASGCSRGPAAYVERGKAELAAEKYADAEIDYSKAMQAKPDFGEAWYGLRLAQFRQGHVAARL